MQTFDPYSPPQAILVRPPTLTPLIDWLYPLTLVSTPTWLLKLTVELRDALGRGLLRSTARLGVVGFRVARLMGPDLPAIEAKPRQLLYVRDLQLVEDGQEVASLEAGLVLAPWICAAPNGVSIVLRVSNPVSRWRAGRGGEEPWPLPTGVGQQHRGVSQPGYPIYTIHAGPAAPPFLVVRRLLSGPFETTRVERLEGEVSREAEWLALQVLTGAYLTRVPGIG
jgi:hypothetical protein